MLPQFFHLLYLILTGWTVHQLHSEHVKVFIVELFDSFINFNNVLTQPLLIAKQMAAHCLFHFLQLDHFSGTGGENDPDLHGDASKWDNEQCMMGMVGRGCSRGRWSLWNTVF